MGFTAGGLKNPAAVAAIVILLGVIAIFRLPVQLLPDIARLHGTAEGADTLFARLTISSGEVQVKKLNFGYSDRVKAYLNGRLIHGGDNSYRTRDYHRYLGTIGLFDALYLPLEPGDNELMLAISESFGGWGVIAAFEDMDGIEVE